MAPPHILPEENYNKPLIPLPVYFSYENILESKYFYNQREGGIFCLKELQASEGSEYSGCIELFYCEFNNKYALDGVCAVADEYSDEYEAADKALEAYEVEKEILIARYAFKDLEIINDSIEITGKQIKGASISANYQRNGVSSFIYKYLLKKYGVLVCDNYQTYKGHMLWVLSIVKLSLIRIYDLTKKEFIGTFDKVSPCLIKPWSVPYNFPPDKEKFLRLDACVYTELEFHSIVLVTFAEDMF